MEHRFLLLPLLVQLAAWPAQAQPTGRVYRDLNANGRWEPPRERGLPGVRVRAYDRTGALLTTVYTDSTGQYRLTAPPGQPLRVQFDGWPEGYFPAPGQYATRLAPANATTGDLGLYQPATFAGERPRAAVSLQPLGDHTDPRGDTLSTLRLVDAGAIQSTKATSAPALRVKPALTGSVWALAYDRTRQRLFSSALAKRHSGFGPLGSGGIYVTDLISGQTKPFLSLSDYGIATAPDGLRRDLQGDYAARQADSLLFAQVGKISLGGLDLADDGRTLYAMNLYDRTLYALTLPADGNKPTTEGVKAYRLPNPGCSGGTFRPFAVKYHQGTVYVGGVCDAHQSGRASDLTAYVYALQGDRFHEVLRFPLDYARGTVEYGVGGWFAWTDDPAQTALPDPAWWAVHPQPILADIEFDEDGAMILGLMDRLGHQMATGKPTADGRWQRSVAVAAGDVLRVSRPARRYRLEADGQVGDERGTGVHNGQGPGGGEFFDGDRFELNGIRYHEETALGGLAVLGDQVLVSTREPVAEYNSGGLSWYDHRTGAKTSGRALYRHDPALEYVARKTNHLGDVELIGEVPPTELGHRLWLDVNENGTQDADEPGLAGVTVQLWRDGKRLAETTTDAGGTYAFRSDRLSDGLVFGAEYEVRVPLSQPGRSRLQPVRHDDQPVPNTKAEPEYAILRFATTAPGETQHGLNVGFRCAQKPTATVQFAYGEKETRLKLTGTQPGQRFDYTEGDRYEGASDAASARLIPKNGVVFTQSANEKLPASVSFRVYEADGCFQALRVEPASGAELRPGQFRLSPNPAVEKIRVAFVDPDPNGKLTDLTVQDGQGRMLQRGKLNASTSHAFELDVRTLTPGVYFVVFSDDLRRFVERFVKQ